MVLGLGTAFQRTGRCSDAGRVAVDLGLDVGIFEDSWKCSLAWKGRMCVCDDSSEGEFLQRALRPNQW